MIEKAGSHEGFCSTANKALQRERRLVCIYGGGSLARAGPQRYSAAAGMEAPPVPFFKSQASVISTANLPETTRDLCTGHLKLYGFS